ncbi:ComF family protein [Deinococcus aquiradiocola]|uniref:Amidophosphoribosyltransferase n=1 Tax=Deinococcus aquiradiocola TaxID=393059 RepID=A0A917UIH9_9DEIO|nr:ComF family protein [Deinococcus aquiradiocola]GGJ60770.1 amidophosphoribosyltransferase [Deinococcus aquiradiocola]
MTGGLHTLLRSLMPRRCPGCDAQLGASAGLCPACRATLRPQVQRHSPLHLHPTPHLVVLGPYRGVLGRSVKALKYGGSREVAGVLGAALASGVPSEWGVQGVSGVPLHRSRQQQRSFNQAELLGRATAERLGVPYLAALARQRSTGAQARRHASERRVAVQDAFVATGAPLPGTLLLVDDVLTTGSTLLACTRALQTAGVQRVYYAVVAR